MLLKPSKQSVKTFLAKIRETIKGSGSMTAGDMIYRLNQQIKGWCMYHRHASSKRTFVYVDARIFRMLWKWCRRRHRKKSAEWIKKRYFERVGENRNILVSSLATLGGLARRVAELDVGTTLPRAHHFGHR